jgi:hypothetical protein
VTSPAIHADHRGRNGSGRYEDSEHDAAAVGLDEAAELGVDAHRLPRPAPTARRAPDLFHQGSHAGERRQQLFSLSLKPRRLVAEEVALLDVQGARGMPRAPARGPRATRPWTEALARPARTGEASVSGSAGAVSSAGSSWRRASRCPTRARTVARTCATSSSLRGGVG